MTLLLLFSSSIAAPPVQAPLQTYMTIRMSNKSLSLKLKNKSTLLRFLYKTLSLSTSP